MDAYRYHGISVWRVVFEVEVELDGKNALKLEGVLNLLFNEMPRCDEKIYFKGVTF